MNDDFEGDPQFKDIESALVAWCMAQAGRRDLNTPEENYDWLRENAPLGEFASEEEAQYCAEFFGDMIEDSRRLKESLVAAHNVLSETRDVKKASQELMRLIRSEDGDKASGV